MEFESIGDGRFGFRARKAQRVADRGASLAKTPGDSGDGRSTLTQRRFDVLLVHIPQRQLQTIIIDALSPLQAAKLRSSPSVLRGRRIMEWSVEAAARLRIASREIGRDKLAAAGGVSVATFERSISATEPRPPKMKEAAGYAQAMGITVAELFTGKAEAAIDPTIRQVSMYDIDVAAGPGRFPLPEEAVVGTWPFSVEWIDRHFGADADLRMVRVSGDSQEPELHDGDAVMIDLNANRLREGMYVVRMGDALLIKRTQREGSVIRLKSANSRYDDVVIDAEQEGDNFAVIARAVWAGKLL